MRDIVTAFIVGSSFPAFFLFFIGFYSYQGRFDQDNCLENTFGLDPYYAYTLLAPLYIGMMSAIAAYLSSTYELSTKVAFGIISFVSAIIVSIAITQCDIYRFDRERLYEQYVRLVFYHALLYVLIVATIYDYIRKD